MEHHPINGGITSGAWSSPFLNEAQWEVDTSPFLAEVSVGRPATPFLDMEEYNDVPAEDELEYIEDHYMGNYEQEAAFSPFIFDLRSKAKKRTPKEEKARGGVSTISRGNPSRRLSEIDAVVLHQMAFNRTNDTNDYLKVVSHYIVLQDGTIGHLWNHEVVLNASSGFNNRSIAIEFAGNFPNDRGKWWYDKDWSPAQRARQEHRPTEPQIQAGRFLLQHLIRTVPSIQFVFAHRQSSGTRSNDPGPDIWYHVAEWAINNLGYNPDGRWVTIKGKGQSIPASWLQPPTFQPQQAVPQTSQSNRASVQPASTSLKPAYAVERNRYWMNQLGWGKYIYQINDFLLPWVGVSQVSMSEALFADAVAAWQTANGFSASESDGIIGPKTWNKLKAAIGIAVQEREYQSDGYEFESSDDGFYESDDAYEMEDTDEDAFESYDDEAHQIDEYEAYTLEPDEEEQLHDDFEDVVTEHEDYFSHEGCSCANCQKQEAVYEHVADEWTSENYEQYYFEDETANASLALPIVATAMPTDSRWILYGTADKRYGIPEIVAALRSIGEQWSQKYPNAKIRIGDISQKGGGKIPGHTSHRLGLDVDINLQVDGEKVLVGKESPATGDSRRMIVSSTYVSQHRNYMREFIRIILGNPILPVQVIGYRDPVLIEEFNVVKDWVGHHNHLHVRFCMPKHRSGELVVNRVYASGKSKPRYTVCDVSSVSPISDANGNSSSWSYAIQQNRYWGQQLGWDTKIYEINDFLLPFVGMSNISMGEDLLAEAISVWQRRVGFTQKDADGILGPKTWEKMKPLLGGTNMLTQGAGVASVSAVTDPSRAVDMELVNKLMGLVTVGVLRIAPTIFELSNVLRLGRDANKVADVLFYAVYRDAPRPLTSTHPLAPEWVLIKSKVQRVLDNKTPMQPTPAPSGVSGLSCTASANNSHVMFKNALYKADGKTYRGISVKATSRPRPQQISTVDDLLIACVSEVEGGFDTVNLYDRGIISWGILQWTIHAGSLQKLLEYMQKRLPRQLWMEMFPGIVIDRDMLVVSGEKYPISQKDQLMKLFRGNISGKDNFSDYDSTTAEKWAALFARAGRQCDVQVLQMEYAKKRIQDILSENLGASLERLRKEAKYKDHINLVVSSREYHTAIGAYIGNSTKAKMLYFGMWVNNPAWAKVKFFQAIQSFEQQAGKINPAAMPKASQQRLADIFESILRKTTIAYWGDEKAKKNDRTSRTEKLIRKYNELLEAFPNFRE